jgi:hypothetical protein
MLNFSKICIITKLSHIGLSVISLFLSLIAWKYFYKFSDWAALSLIPLVVMLFCASYSLSIRVFVARLQCILIPGSPLSTYLTGRIGAIFSATIFVMILMPLLAWQSLTITSVEWLMLLALSVLASIVFLLIKLFARKHLREPSDSAAALVMGSWGLTLIALPILTWLNWNYTDYPGEIRTQGVVEAASMAIDKLPARRGFFAEILAPLYAVDALKLWLAVRLNPSTWVPALYSIDAALVSFVFIRASMSLTWFFSLYLTALRGAEDVTNRRS